MELKLNIKAKHESRTRLNQLGRLAHNRYASFAHTIIEKIRNFITKNFLPNLSMNSHKNLVGIFEVEERQLRERYEAIALKLQDKPMPNQNFAPFDNMIAGVSCAKVFDGYIFQNYFGVDHKAKIEDFTKSSFELSDGNIIIMIHLKRKIDHDFPVWVVENYESEQEQFFSVRKFCEGVHSKEDGPFCLIDKFENVQNLEIDDFFKYNYENNKSFYNSYFVGEFFTGMSMLDLNEKIYFGWLERWKNRF